MLLVVLSIPAPDEDDVGTTTTEGSMGLGTSRVPGREEVREGDEDASGVG